MAEATANLGKLGAGDVTLHYGQDNRTYNEYITILKEKQGLTLRGKDGLWPS